MTAFGSLDRQLGGHSQDHALRAGQPITRDADLQANDLRRQWTAVGAPRIPYLSWCYSPAP